MNAATVTNRAPLKFFLLVYAMSIPLWILETLIDVKGLPLDIPVTDIVAVFTPVFAACILIYKDEGRVGINKLFRRIFDYNRITKKIWYVPVIFLPFVIYFLVYIIILLAGLPMADKSLSSVLSVPVLFIFFFIGATAEEVGYTGYAIEPLQQRFGAVAASIIIGIPWAVWHYPSIIQQGHNLTWIAWGTLGTVAVRILIVWIFNNTGKSLFACILFHTMINLGRPLFPRDATHNPLVDYPGIHYSMIAVTAVIVIFLWGTKTLARFRYHNLITQ